MVDRRILPRAVAVAAISGVALAGCTSGGERSVEPTQRPTSASASPTPHKTEQPRPQPLTLAGYESSPARNAQITAAVQRFGEKVVVQFEQSKAGPWGALDAFCAPANGNGGPEGYTSQGFKPQTGDQCDIQHNPQYDGEPIQVDATVLVGPKSNAFTDIVGITINTPKGVTNIDDYNSATGWSVDYGKNPVADLKESKSPPTTVSGAKTIDQEALQLIKNTAA